MIYQPLITNDAINLGIILTILAIISVTSESKNKFISRFYIFIPSLLLCYFIPALLNWPLGVIGTEWFDIKSIIIYLNDNYHLHLNLNTSIGEINKIIELNKIDISKLAKFKKTSQLNYVASNYILPAALILMTLNIDFKGLIKLGPKAVLVFLSGSLGIIVGGPATLYIVMKLMPGVLPFSADDIWKGMSTIAGSWIGGSPNQTAMKEILNVKDNVFASFIVVDVIVANVWMGLLLAGASIHPRLDRWIKADSSSINDLVNKMEEYRKSTLKIPSTSDIMLMLAVAFGGVALSQLLADILTPLISNYEEVLNLYNLNWLNSNFFWLIIFATMVGILLSFTRFRRLEGIGASKWGSIGILILVATIGMKMNLKELANNLGLFSLGIIWMFFHALFMLISTKLLKAPFFFFAVGSQANIGGAASAPIVASAFNPNLAPVGVILAILGYAIGTYGAILCGIMMQYVAHL